MESVRKACNTYLAMFSLGGFHANFSILCVCIVTNSDSKYNRSVFIQRQKKSTFALQISLVELPQTTGTNRYRYRYRYR